MQPLSPRNRTSRPPNQTPLPGNVRSMFARCSILHFLFVPSNLPISPLNSHTHNIFRLCSEHSVHEHFVFPPIRVWLCSFRAVSVRWPDTRISDGENEQIVNAHPEVPFCQWKEVRRGISFRSEIRIMGTVPNLGDLTTDEYSFVIKCTASRHLPVRRKNSSALQGRWLEEPEGVPILSFRKGNKRVVTALRMANKTAIMAAARETKGHYGRRKANRRGVTPPWV